MRCKDDYADYVREILPLPFVPSVSVGAVCRLKYWTGKDDDGFCQAFPSDLCGRIVLTMISEVVDGAWR